MTTDTMADMVNTNGVQNRLLGALYPILVLFGAYSWLFYKSKVVYLYDIILLKIILLKQFSVYIHDHLISAIGSQKYHACLCLLDISAVFDTTDHGILITRLSFWFGIHGPVLSWFKSYLSSRCFRVKCESDLSSWHTSSCGVPKVLSLVHYSSSCTPLLSVLSFPLVP